MKRCILMSGAVLCLVVSPHASAQSISGYRASLGIMRGAQCWRWGSENGLSAGYNRLFVERGELRLKTDGLPTIGAIDNEPYAVHWERNTEPFRFMTGFEMEATLRVIAVGESTASTCRRTGLTFNAIDDDGRVVCLWWGPGGLYFDTGFCTPMTQAPVMPLPGSSEHHTYRVETLGGFARCLVDGELLAELPLGELTGRTRRVCFGDATRWRGANVDVAVRTFGFTSDDPPPFAVTLTSSRPACDYGFNFADVDSDAPGSATYEWQLRSQTAPDTWERLYYDGVFQGLRFVGVHGPSLLFVTDLRRLQYPTRTLRCVVMLEGTCTGAASDELVIPSCLTDLTCDRGVDADDVIAFFGYWNAANLTADFDRDEDVDADDVVAFFDRWDVGC